MNNTNEIPVQSIEEIPAIAYLQDIDTIRTVRKVASSLYDMHIKKKRIQIPPMCQTLGTHARIIRHANLIRLVEVFLRSIPDLINREPNDALRMYLDAVKSLLAGNEIGAKARIGRALHLDPGFQAARWLFQVAFPKAKPGDSAESWALVGADLDGLARKHIEAAVRRFGSRQFEAADHHMQIYNALRTVDFWSPSDLATCRVSMASLVRDGLYDNAIDSLAEQKRRDYAMNWPNRADEFIKEYVASVDDAIISGIAELAIDLAPNRRFLDFGAYVCIVPTAIRQRIGDGLFHAVEPDAQAVAYVRKNLDFVTIHEGSHEEMITGRFDIPNVDVVIAHRVLGVIHPKEVERIFGFLAGKTRRLLISDDVLNFEGDRAVIRLGVDRFAHNYGRMLDAVGFRTQRVQLPPRVERYLTGVIIAER